MIFIVPAKSWPTVFCVYCLTFESNILGVYACSYKMLVVRNICTMSITIFSISSRRQFFSLFFQFQRFFPMRNVMGDNSFLDHFNEFENFFWHLLSCTIFRLNLPQTPFLLPFFTNFENFLWHLVFYTIIFLSHQLFYYFFDLENFLHRICSFFRSFYWLWKFYLLLVFISFFRLNNKFFSDTNFFDLENFLQHAAFHNIFLIWKIFFDNQFLYHFSDLFYHRQQFFNIILPTQKTIFDIQFFILI